MAFIAAIFSRQHTLDAALKTLYSTNIGDADVTLMRDDGTAANDRITRSDEPTMPMVPLGMGTNSSDTTAQSTISLIDDLDLNPDAKAFYRQTVDEGKSAVVFVKLDSQYVDTVRGIFEDENATRVDVLRN